MIERDFTVTSKGVKGKHQTPYVTFQNADGEKLTIHFESKQNLDDFQIDQEVTIKIVEGVQQKIA